MMWGDEPQDLVDEAIEEKLGFAYSDIVAEVPLSRRKEIYDLLLEDDNLRTEVGYVYDEDLNRSMNKAEYKNLLKVGLGLGGRSITFFPTDHLRWKGNLILKAREGLELES